MDGRSFDDLARALASGTSRRAVLRGAIGVAAAGLWGRGLATAAASATCHGVAYDPSAQCCIAGTIRQLNPISDLSACPNRVPNPNHVPAFNGCGAAGGGFNPPEAIARADFTTACNHHDLCYDTCNSDKVACDETFLEDLQDACNLAYDQGDRRRRGCLQIARAYYLAVRRTPQGQAAYREAQKRACLCCPGDCQDCGPCDHCIDGACVPRCDAGQCQTCANGTCVGCDASQCQTCQNGACVGCDATNCEACDNGQCRLRCAEELCQACDGSGGCVPRCPPDECLDGVCDPGYGTCGNGIKDGDETDVDCGGPGCPPCDVEQYCTVDADCRTDRFPPLVCYQGLCREACPEGAMACGNVGPTCCWAAGNEPICCEAAPDSDGSTWGKAGMVRGWCCQANQVCVSVPEVHNGYCAYPS